jgi:hypothetical protein
MGRIMTICVALATGLLLLVACTPPAPPAVTYNVTYNGNGKTGGSVPTDSHAYEEGETVTVLGNTGSLINIPPAGTAEAFKFGVWNTQADGLGTDYAASATFTMGTADVVLYAKWVPFVLRDIGPSGGWIFYDKGSFLAGWRYLEASPVAQFPAEWGASGSAVTGADGTAIGTGKQNTIDITTAYPSADYAANLCADYSVTDGGVTYDDWFLPSQAELNQMYVNLKVPGIGGFAGNYYWSSSENDATNAWAQYFSNGTQSQYDKDYIWRVRAARAF